MTDGTIRTARWVLLAAAAAFALEASAFDLTGTVIDPDGKGVADASVWLVQARVVQVTRTDAAGAFAFHDAIPALSEFVALKDGFAVGGRRAHVVGPDDVRIVLVEPDTAEIRIIDHTYQPVEGVRVKSLTVGGAFRLSLDDLATRGFPSLRSDREGRLAIPFLPKGGHIAFIIAHRNHADTRIAYLPVDHEQHTVQVYPGVRVRGRVTNEAKAGVAEAEVALVRADGQGRRMATRSVTDREGFFVASVRPGDYYATVKHGDYASPRPTRLSARSRNEDAVVDLVLPEAHAIEGCVANLDGDPLGGVWVEYLVGKGVYDKVLTTNDGRFRFQVAKGEGRVHVTPPEGYVNESPLDVTVVVEDESQIDMPPIRLKALPEIVGTVEAPDGTALSRVLISSMDLDPPVWALTDESGAFRILLRRAPRESKARFRVEHGLHFLRGEFAVNLSDPGPVRVRLESFEPDLSRNDPKRARNDLEGLVGAAAPAWVCQEWFNAEPVTLDDVRGKVVVLILWGGFANIGPGRDQIEELRALHSLLRDVEELAFVGVHDSGVEPEMANQYVEEYGVEFPVGFDSDAAETFDLYDISVIPQIVLIDKKGIVRYYDVDGRLLELIKSLLRKA